MQHILNQIIFEMQQLEKLEFKDIEEARLFFDYHYMITYVQCGLNIKDDVYLSNYKTEENPNNIVKIDISEKDKPITVIDLFILCHRTYYQDEKFIDFKEKIYDNDRLLKEIINSSESVVYYNQKKDMWVDYKLNYKLIKGTIFDNEKYIKTLKNILNVLFAKKKNIIPINNNNEMLKTLGLYQLSEDMRIRHNFLVKKNNRFCEQTRKQCRKYKRLLKRIKDIKDLPFIINVQDLDGLSDETIYSLYRDVTVVNQNHYEVLIEKKKKLQLDCFKNNKSVLKNCGFDIGKIPESKLNFLLHYGNIKELTKIIPFLNNIDYNLIDIYSDNGLYILVNTNFDIVNRIYNLIVNNIINQKFIMENPRIFFNCDIVNNLQGCNDTLFMNTKNLEHNYNLKNSYANEVLLIDPNLLTNNINMLKKYHSFLNCSILKNTKLFDCLDLLIELGLSKVIETNQYTINENSYDDIKMVYVAKLLNNDYQNLIDVLETKTFYIPFEQLNDYIMNDVNEYLENDIREILDNNPRNVIEDNYLKQFDNYLKDNLTYDFNGILISKNKILRNLFCLENSNLDYCYDDLLFSAIIYGSILDYEQIESIKDFIYKKRYTKKIGS